MTRRKPKAPPASARQLNDILLAMLKREHLTVLGAITKYGCYALSQRCGELEREYGWPIKRDWLSLPSGKRVRVYSL